MDTPPGWDWLPDRIRDRPVLSVIVLIALLAVTVRLIALGFRVFYYDEAWFGYWVLRFMENGSWSYRPILHGPFYVRVNPLVFDLFGVSDATARLVPALMGGLLPVAAWLYREHLSDGELVALAALLAANPVLFYYSRFMRKDLPLAALIFVAVGLVVRTMDTRDPRYLYGAGLSLGVAASTKESFLLWIITIVGGLVFVADTRMLEAGRSWWVSRTVRSTLWPAAAGTAHTSDDAGEGRLADLDFWFHHGVVAAVLAVAMIVFFYAPRAGPGQEIGLWAALTGEFLTLPAVLWAATGQAFLDAIDYWVLGGIQEHAYLPYLVDTFKTMLTGATVVTVFGAIGALIDRYREPSRPIVTFYAFCAGAATLGYPLANNLPVPWSTVHAIVPLAVPAAVGIAATGRAIRALDERRATADDQSVTRSVATVGLAFVLVGAAVWMGAIVVQTSYVAPHDSAHGETGHEIVYYAQPPGELRTVTDAIDRVASADRAGPDVLFVGSSLQMDESRVDLPPATGAWHARMPLPWYTEQSNADLASVRSVSAVGDTPPPIVITTTSLQNDLRGRLGEDYRGTHHDLDEAGDRSVVVFVHDSIRRPA
ncbi:flippase activity-associated protein Agl23 [Halococcoides cellulosivorans]|uniref:TIGR03663 family protein n=1 Tax=Halococcoides cellulosivorans TaxID=1679096 RepID=A0A2R4X0N6_9EURY|nr:flippase activity-associated protein Agl23 [Halococcoides cellulosivorans]AWB27360.1 TIGR03663 family protein [Halococcoides cellulosivorans]